MTPSVFRSIPSTFLYSLLRRPGLAVPWDSGKGRRLCSIVAESIEPFRQEFQDVFHDFPEFDNLSLNLRVKTTSTKSETPDIMNPKLRERARSRSQKSGKESYIPTPLCGVPLLEELFRKNSDSPSTPNEGLMRILTHESVLYRGFMERNRRARPLAKFMTRQSRLEINHVNRAWILQLANLLRNPSFTFAPEKSLSFSVDGQKEVNQAIPSPRDEIILDAMRLVMDGICEPRFSNLSFGLRPDQGRQLALRNLKNYVRGMSYYIVINLSSVLQKIRGFQMVKAACEHIHDPIFEQLLYKALEKGYVNTFGLKPVSFISVPREFGISPVLVNCFLDPFDKWLGIYREAYSDYERPLKWPINCEFTPPADRRLRFVRCGPEILIALHGNKAEAHCVANDALKMLQGMDLKAGPENVDVHHTFLHKRTVHRAQFLGFELSREVVPDDVPTELKKVHEKQTRPLFHIPTLQLRDCFLDNGFIRMSKSRSWTPFGNGFITHWPVEHLVRYFDRLTVGLLEFYAMADNFLQLHWFVYILKRSCNLTIGRKLKLRSMRKVFVKYGRDLEVMDGDRIVATLPDRSLSVRPIIHDFHPELVPYLRRRRYITRRTRSAESSKKGNPYDEGPVNETTFPS